MASGSPHHHIDIEAQDLDSQLRGKSPVLLYQLRVLIVLGEVGTSMMHIMGFYRPQANTDSDTGQAIPVSAPQRTTSVNPQLVSQLEGVSSISARYCILMMTPTTDRVLSVSWVYRNPGSRTIGP